MVGLQYYHAAKIFLTASHARWCPGSDYEVARSRRIAEVGIRYRGCSTATNMGQKVIAGHLLVVIGLSLSNESVHNGYFMACHLLHRCKFPPWDISMRLLRSRWVLFATSNRTTGIAAILKTCGKCPRLAKSLVLRRTGAAVEGNTGAKLLGELSCVEAVHRAGEPSDNSDGILVRWLAPNALNIWASWR